MNVLHVHAGNLYGGVETIMTSLVRHRALAPGLDQRFALCFEGRLSRELGAREAQDAMDAHDAIDARGAPSARVTMLGPVRVSRPWTVWRARRRLADLLRREPCDAMIVHSAWSHVVFAPVGRAGRVPLVFWLHGEVSRSWPERWARRAPPDLVLCNSRFTCDSLPRLFAGVRSEVLYAPLGPDASHASRAAIPSHASIPSRRSTLRAALGAPPGAVAILMIARMEPGKGHPVLLEALARLPAEPPWTAWIAGGAQRAAERAYRDGLLAQAARRNLAERVRFLGARTDVGALLAACDVVCQPNTSPEGFGLAFVEALYAGRPVVTSDLGAAPEVVDASCGLLVPPGDAQALAGALASLLGDPARRAALGAAGPQRARALCAPETQMPRLEQLLRMAATA